MSEVSVFRLYLLRAMYLLLAAGLGITIWPGILAPPDDLSHMASVVRSVLGAIGLLALLGVRYPLQMLPLLLFELLWKFIWVLAFGLPLWRSDRLDANTGETLRDCLMGVVLVAIAMPWGYVFTHYLRRSGDRWSRTRQGVPADGPRPAGSAHG
ncbi:MAG TPA: hypothetical protein VFE28_01370 [Candidatus Krumholzibacteria bacterium]|nr:hypothetical protein [Candidatus Krumholzibacteria bacterium]